MRRGTAGVLLLAGLLAACGGTGAGAPPDGLAATVEQSRDNENRGLLQLVLTNDGGTDLHVRRVQLDSPGYEPAPAGVFDQRVGAGSRTAFPVEEGDVRCGASPRGSAVRAWLQDGGSVREVRVPVPDGDPVLPRLHARECALQRLREAVEVSLAGPWERSGDTVSGRLVLTRRAGDEQVRVTDAQSSIILLLRSPALPLVLAAGSARAELAVQVQAVRCDPHALIESKRTFTFPVFVALGDGEPLSLSVTADEPGRAVLQSALQERCAAAGIDLAG